MASTALKKIVARVKQLRKKHPNAKYKSLQKQAGREFKAGKLKAKRKPAKRKAVRKVVKRKAIRKTAPRKTVRRKTRRKVGTVKRRRTTVKRKRTVTRYVSVKRRRYRKIGGTGSGTILLVAGIAVVGLLAWLILKPSSNSTTTYIPTGNQARDSSASTILTWATAANLGASAFKSILDAINGSSDSQLAAATSGGTINLNALRPPAGGINL